MHARSKKLSPRRCARFHRTAVRLYKIVEQGEQCVQVQTPVRLTLPCTETIWHQRHRLSISRVGQGHLSVHVKLVGSLLAVDSLISLKPVVRVVHFFGWAGISWKTKDRIISEFFPFITYIEWIYFAFSLNDLNRILFECHWVWLHEIYSENLSTRITSLFYLSWRL